MTTTTSTTTVAPTAATISAQPFVFPQNVDGMLILTIYLKSGGGKSTF